MQNVSIKKLSILGLVLMAASAVTAAILPNKTSKVDNKFAQLPSATASTDAMGNPAGQTCQITETDVNAPRQLCLVTAGPSVNTGTTGNIQFPSSDGLNGATTVEQ